MPNEIQPGDVVHLKSGSQRMTVISVNEEGQAALIWLPYNGVELQHLSLPTVALRHADQKEMSRGEA